VNELTVELISVQFIAKCSLRREFSSFPHAFSPQNCTLANTFYSVPPTYQSNQTKIINSPSHWGCRYRN